ncbi:MAG TPA: cyanophycinase [Pseudolysinimonas sp.]|nr:cyanophycinase [Pseudolysinimonas sp.]
MPEGTLLAIGGHEDRDGARHILRRVAELVEGRELGLITAASSHPQRYIDMYRSAFAGLGVEVRPVPGDATEGRRVLRECGSAFLSGGKQRKLMRRLRVLGLDDEVRRIHREGGLVAGTSAGASVQSDRMISPHGLDEGLGLIGGVLIDQHFSERGRMLRLARAVRSAPARLGIGIDEDTAVEVRAGTLTVRGSGTVTLLDLRRAETGGGGFRDGTMHLLSEGEAFELPL